MAAALAQYSLHPVSKALVAALATPERAKSWHADRSMKWLEAVYRARFGRRFEEQGQRFGI